VASAEEITLNPMDVLFSSAVQAIDALHPHIGPIDNVDYNKKATGYTPWVLPFCSGLRDKRGIDQ